MSRCLAEFHGHPCQTLLHKIHRVNLHKFNLPTATALCASTAPASPNGMHATTATPTNADKELVQIPESRNLSQLIRIRLTLQQHTACAGMSEVRTTLAFNNFMQFVSVA